MSTEARIEACAAAQPGVKSADMRELHARILRLSPGCRLWFRDGRNEAGKIVSYPKQAGATIPAVLA